MSPSPPISDVADQAHGYVEARGEFFTNTMALWGGKNLHNLSLSQLGRPHTLSFRPLASRPRPPVIFTATDFFRVPSRIMIFAAKTLNFRLWPGAAPSGSMPIPISGVFRWCSPVKITRAVVGSIAVLVGAMGFLRRAFSIERCAHKAVN